MSGISRRDFVKRGVSLGVSAGLFGRFGPAFGGEWDEEAEFIVIGSGAGGGPVCARLAEKGFNVLLLEAGGREENDNYRVPAFHGNSTDDPAYAWSYFVKHYKSAGRNRKQYNSKYVEGKGILYPRAGTLGGCTAHNAMITMYPDNRDWDRIARLTRDDSWESDKMRLYFQKLEAARYKDPEAGNEERHGFYGWLSAEQVDRKLLLKDRTLLKMVLAAAQEGHVAGSLLERLFGGEVSLDDLFDLDPNDWDFVSNRREGVIITPKATLNGRRNGTRELLLRTRLLHGKNFKIKTQSLATRLLFEGDTNRVIGVEYREGEHLYEADPASGNLAQERGVIRRARALREVILAGGAFNSPQLLMLSGIGPALELTRHGIGVKVPLEGVGKNLQDRYEVTVVTQLKKPLEVLKGCTFGARGDPAMQEYLQNPTAHVYGTNGVVVGYKKRFERGDPARDPDIFVFGLPGDFRGYYPNWSKDALKVDHFTWAVLQGHTKNTNGEVTLKSINPRQTPEINFNYFDEGNDPGSDDIDAVLEGVKFARQVNANESAQEVTNWELHPGPGYRSDEELKSFIQKEAWGHHASCSNRMGAIEDPKAVVDSQFRVRHVRGLRIVDASIFPNIPGLFIVVPIYMAAEKAAETILREYGRGQR